MWAHVAGWVANTSKKSLIGELIAALTLNNGEAIGRTGPTPTTFAVAEAP